MYTSIRFWLVICLVSMGLTITQAKAEPIVSLPKINNPTPPPTQEGKPSVEEFLLSRTKRFDVKGRISGFTDGKIWVNQRGYLPSKEIQCLKGGETIFESDLKKGMEVGLVLWPDGSILQVWDLPPR